MTAFIDTLLGRTTLEVMCDIDIEKTPESLHAHAIPDGIDIRPGDLVTVHGVPTEIGFGETRTMQCRATVRRAGWFDRAWTEFAAIFEIAELYHVGFEPADFDFPEFETSARRA